MLVNTYPHGKLGNKLTLFGHLIAYSLKYDIPIANTTFFPYAEHFVTTRDDLFCRFPPRRSWIRPTMKRRLLLAEAFRVLTYQSAKRKIPFLSSRMIFDDYCRFDLHDPDFIRSSRRGIALMWSWGFQDYPLMKSYADAIRRHLTPVPEIVDRVERTEAAARRKGSLLVGVHVRQIPAETADHPDYQYYSMEQYCSMMRMTQRLFHDQDPSFLICSDVPQDLHAFAGLAVTAGPGDAVGDLYSLARCDYVIASPSTFSWWAAFYGDKPLYIVDTYEETFSREKFRRQGE